METTCVIRAMLVTDIRALSAIWLQASLRAHHFIHERYWLSNKSAVEKEYLPGSETYVAEAHGIILGFITLNENLIASAFVLPDRQGNGIGSALIAYVKGIRSELSLHVYKKNERSVGFYTSQGFHIAAVTVDQATQENEFIMQWKKTSGNTVQ